MLLTRCAKKMFAKKVLRKYLIDGSISEPTKVVNGPLLILDMKVNGKKFKDTKTKGNHGHSFKLQKCIDKDKFAKNFELSVLLGGLCKDYNVALSIQSTVTYNLYI